MSAMRRMSNSEDTDENEYTVRTLRRMRTLRRISNNEDTE